MHTTIRTHHYTPLHTTHTALHVRTHAHTGPGPPSTSLSALPAGVMRWPPKRLCLCLVFPDVLHQLCWCFRVPTGTPHPAAFTGVGVHSSDLMGADMCPPERDVPVLAPSTGEWTLFGNRVFADVIKEPAEIILHSGWALSLVAGVLVRGVKRRAEATTIHRLRGWSRGLWELRTASRSPGCRTVMKLRGSRPLACGDLLRQLRGAHTVAPVLGGAGRVTFRRPLGTRCPPNASSPNASVVASCAEDGASRSLRCPCVLRATSVSTAPLEDLRKPPVRCGPLGARGPGSDTEVAGPLMA
ncbi:uncharacterized protein LOC129049391 [Pongo abelii]|uniref:uncharacterized protein LOC129049391 n=1 Tax=Pongo abelii TaxID=9601 RepID=UPI0023E7CC73|nr:uncharacterized protein LOC129049391 [Pongo abelii]